MTPTLAARWHQALARATAEGLTLRHVGDGFAECTSGSAPGRRYLLCAEQCSCPAGAGPICKHRALYRKIARLAPFDAPAPAPAEPVVVHAFDGAWSVAVA